MPPPPKTTRLQQIIVSLIYYYRDINNKLLPALNIIALKQAATKKQTEYQCHRFVDHVATQPKISLRFHKSDMVLTIDSDDVYLVEQQSRSRVAGYFQLNSNNKPSQFVNGVILI